MHAEDAEQPVPRFRIVFDAKIVAKLEALERRRRQVEKEVAAEFNKISGGMRRTWLHELVNVTKRYLIAAAAHNLGRVLRKLFGIGKPKALQGQGGLAALTHLIMLWLLVHLWRLEMASRAPAAIPGACAAAA